ncbi:hypothetical protein QBC39DRAFT_258966 [Podospora conica]|nr:hypothetical protein QBC39DRAFT_258966 [Schizothecium conicum]
MATRYTADLLLHLRDSPLCVKPSNLPPAAEWMGAPPETFRQQPKLTTERVRGGIGDGVLLNQENRRPALDRNGTRSSANPDDFILGPPRSNFASATASRGARLGTEPDRGQKEPERQDRPDRFGNLRTRTADIEGSSNDRFRDRDGRPNFRRRGDQDQDPDGWTPVKPRKSFGAEGAERFHMRAGAAGERTGGRDDRRARDRDDREPGARTSRNINDFFNLGALKDKDGEELEEPRRNGPTRGKSDSWFRGDTAGGDAGNGEGAPVSQRERIDKAKSWRDRDPNANNDRRGERTNERNQERRWEREREQRNERDPEWLDEPAGETPQGRTQEDFERFMETMKGKSAPKPDQKAPEPVDKQTVDTHAELEQKPALSAPAHDPPAEDKFLSMFGGQSQFTTLSGAAEPNEATRPKPVKATSRFMNFLPTSQDRARTEPPTPAATANANNRMPEPPSNNPDKEAFAALISKLKGSRMDGSPDGPSQASESLAKLFQRPPAQQEPPPPKSAMAPPEAFQQYGGELREDPRMRGPLQHQSHQMISPRQMMPPTQPPPVSHPEQALHDLLAQRHNLPNLQNQGNNRAPPNNPPMNSNTEFLMRLMQSQRDVPEPSPNRPEMLSRMSQPTKQDYQRDPGQSQRQQYHQQILQQQQQQAQQRQHVRGPPVPPGYMEDQFHSPEMDSRPQPTQILQRPPPPGMDHHGMHPFQMGPGPAGAGGPMPPPPQQQQQQQRSMIPPPGLVNQRNVNAPPQSLSGMYPNYPPPGPGYGAPPLPPPDSLGPGPRGIGPPPGFFSGALPPPGFMPPPGMSPGGFQGGPDGLNFGPPGPYDRRAMAPPGYRGP